jgi:hypothetical protein
MQTKAHQEALKYLAPDNLYEQIKSFTKGMKVTRDKFELVIPDCKLEDIEWNHMDQMHRLSVHNTYEKSVRIACGRDFAVSLTQWGKWPLFIPVTDVYIARGMFYQSLAIAGIIFLHSIISMEEIPGTNSVKLVDEWFIASHKLFGILHRPLNRQLHVLNTRLQKEDEQIRQGRFILRQKGYTFKTDQPDYYNSNRLTTHTIYPEITSEGISVADITDETSVKTLGSVDFIVKKENETYLIWPAVCPHEGGPLSQAKDCDGVIACPWHGLKFRAVSLSKATPVGTRYGFEYQLINDAIYIQKLVLETTQATETLSVTA